MILLQELPLKSFSKSPQQSFCNKLFSIFLFNFMVFVSQMQCYTFLIDRNTNNCKLCNLLISNCCQLRNNFLLLEALKDNHESFYKILLHNILHMAKGVGYLDTLIKIYSQTYIFHWPRSSASKKVPQTTGTIIDLR